MKKAEQEDRFFKMLEEHKGILSKLIYLYAFNPADRKDMKQEMILQLWKSFDRFGHHSHISTWMYKVCLNTALNFHKKHKRHQYDEIENLSSAIAVEENRDDKQLLYQLVTELNEIDRMLISLFLEGYKNIEIAEITGMTVNNVNVKIHRIKSKLIETLNQYNNESR